MQRLDFSMKRYINAHTDFTEKMYSGRLYEKSFIKGNNQLPVYSGLQNNGVIDVKEGSEYNMVYYVKDVYDNLSTLTFKLTPVAEQVNPNANDSALSALTKISYKEDYTFKTDNFSVLIPQNTLYDDIYYKYNTYPKPSKAYSVIHEIGDRKIPVHDFFEIAIKPETLPERLNDKACIISQTSGYIGGYYDNGWIKAKSRALGKFYVFADTTPPVIIPLNIKAAGSNLSRSSGIRFKISDNLSGIKTYKGKIDGNWVVFYYDAKYALIYYLFDDNCPPGTHKLEMEVTDNKGNVRRWKANFTR
jgi:hypothetical protein